MAYPNHRHDDFVREFKYRYHEPKLVEVQRPLRLAEPSYYQPAPMYGGPRHGAAGGGSGMGYWRWRRERENRRFMWYVIIIVLLVASFLMLAALAMSQGAPAA
jgi:hypothetical protein